MSIFERVKMTVSGTPGTGTVTLGTKVAGHFSFDDIGVPNGVAGIGYMIEDGNNVEIGKGTYTASGTTFARDTVTKSLISGTAGTSKVTLTSAAIVSLWPDKANFLLADTSNTIATGFPVTPYNLGTKSTNWTADPTLGNVQYMTNHGAHQITAPSVDCEMEVVVTNDASAGSITFSGFTGSIMGDTYATTNANVYTLVIRRINGTTRGWWLAWQ